MNSPINRRVVLRPLICFGLVLLSGALGFGYAKLTNNGFWGLGFLLVLLPCSLITCIVGTVFTIKAFAVLPADHWGRFALSAMITLVLLGFALCCWILISAGPYITGGL